MMASLRWTSLTLAFACAGAVAQTQPPACATVNVTTILRDSGSAKAAAERLTSEFAPRRASLQRLLSKRKRTERLWLDAREAGRPEDEVNALKAQA